MDGCAWDAGPQILDPVAVGHDRRRGQHLGLWRRHQHQSAVFLDVPAELKGKINVVPEMNDVIGLATMYYGGEPCSEDLEVLKKVRDALAAKPNWISMDYGATEKMSNNDWAASVNWNGSSMRVRLANPDVAYGYPKEGYIMWMDSVMLLKDAQNVEEAYKFLDFIMKPENAAMISAFARYANGIAGSEAFMDPDMATAPEVVIPEEFKAAGHFYAGLQRKIARIHDRDLDRVAEVIRVPIDRSAGVASGGFTLPPGALRPPWDIWRRESHAGMVGNGAVVGDPCAQGRAVRGDGGLAGAGAGGERGGECAGVAARSRCVDGRGAGAGRCGACGLAAWHSLCGQGSGGDQGAAHHLGLALFADHVPVAGRHPGRPDACGGGDLCGKTNVPEWGQGSHSFNPIFGVTRNPYDLTRSAGGSSGGAAAALGHADGLGRGRVGHDGVIAQPGGILQRLRLRPTWGLVPSDAEGDTFIATLATEGPMARTIEDLARLLLVQAGENPEVPFPRAVPDVLSGLDRGVKGLRIGWLGDWGGAYPMEPGILDACARRACGCWRVWGRWSNRWPRPSRPKSCGNPGSRCAPC
jgi:hypothetical protein